jgi:hypothetical protein
MGMITVEGPASGRPYRVNISGDAPTPEEQARIDQFLAQSEAPYLQMYNELFGATTPVAPEAPVEEDDGTAIGRGFRSGIQNIRSLIGTTIEETGRAAGLEGVQEFGRGMETAAEEEFRKLREIRERTGLYDVEDVGSALTYGGEHSANKPRYLHRHWLAPPRVLVLALSLVPLARGLVLLSVVP